MCTIDGRNRNVLILDKKGLVWLSNRLDFRHCPKSERFRSDFRCFWLDVQIKPNVPSFRCFHQARPLQLKSGSLIFYYKMVQLSAKISNRTIEQTEHPKTERLITKSFCVRLSNQMFGFQMFTVFTFFPNYAVVVHAASEVASESFNEISDPGISRTGIRDQANQG